MDEGAGRGGSDLGRPAIDWEAAFTFYASLPPERRSYQAVADQFVVSVRTVEKHGRQEGWKQRLAEIKARVAEETNSSLSAAHVEHLENLIKLTDALKIAFADQLRRGDMRQNPADLERMHKLRKQLIEELAEPALTGPEQPGLAPSPRTPEHTADVIKALQDSGALEALGLQALEAPSSDGEEA